MGRHRADARKFFEEDDTGEHQKCKFCHLAFAISFDGFDMDNHVRTCKDIPAADREQYVSSHPRKKKVKQSPIDAFASPFNAKEALKLLCFFFYACNIPFHAVEDSYFHAFIRMLNPSFILPNRRALAGTLLDETYQKVKELDAEVISQQHSFTLVSDGWTNIKRESVINFILCSGDMKPLFWKAVFTGGLHHTSAYICELMQKVIEEIGVKKIFSIITDNAANMILAHRLLREKYPRLITFGCVGHAVHLICKDIIALEPFARCFRAADKLIKTVRQSNILVNHMKPFVLIQYRSQRWGTACRAMKSIMKCRGKIEQEVVGEEMRSNFSDEQRDFVHGRDSWVLIERLISLLEPLVNLLEFLESDKPYMSKVFQYFASLLLFVRRHSDCSDEATSLEDICRHRWNLVYRKQMILAHVLDPSTKKVLSNTEGFPICSDSLKDILPPGKFEAGNSQLQQFMQKTGYFDRRNHMWSDNETKDALSWWKRNVDPRVVPELFAVANRMLTIPATSSSAERNWWAFSRYHSRFRAALSSETVERLVKVHGHLRATEFLSSSRFVQTHSVLQVLQDSSDVDAEVFDQETQASVAMEEQQEDDPFGASPEVVIEENGPEQSDEPISYEDYDMDIARLTMEPEVEPQAVVEHVFEEEETSEEELTTSPVEVYTLQQGLLDHQAVRPSQHLPEHTECLPSTTESRELRDRNTIRPAVRYRPENDPSNW